MLLIPRNALSKVPSLLATLVICRCVALSAGSDTTVAIDPQSGDLRVSYSEYGAARSFLVSLTNHVAPQIEESTENRDGRFVYAYKVANAPSAKQFICNVWVVVNPDIHLLSVEAPNLWGHDPVIPTSINPRASTYLDPPGLLVRWSPKYGQLHEASSGSILPGLQQGPFVVSSDARPGFVRGFFASYVDRYEDDPIFSAPADVWREAEPYLNGIRQGSVLSMVVGPSFPPSLGPSDVAVLLLKQIRQLVEVRQLSTDSPFLNDVEQFLTPLSENSVPLATARAFHSPGTRTESDLASVLQINFHSALHK